MNHVANQPRKTRKSAAKKASTKKGTKKSTSKGAVQPTTGEMNEAYRWMMTSRILDKKMLILLKQGKSYFHIGCMGHEAIQAAAATALTRKHDWIYPYYRGQTFCLGMGMTSTELLYAFLSKADDPASGGRQMPQHYGHKEWNIPSQSSPTGTQFLQAVGCALANVQHHKRDGGELAVTVVTSGEGTTSQGDFHEALNWAARDKAPVIFLVENNGYAISVPASTQTPGGKTINLGHGYDGMACVSVDGCNFEQSLDVMRQAVARARAGEGPTFVEADVVRLLPHSSSDDQRKYRPSDELEADGKRDPIVAMREAMVSAGAMTEADLDKLDAELKDAVDAAAEVADAAPMPARETAKRWVFSETPEPPLTTPQTTGGPVVLVDAINRALREELARNPEMWVFGEDVAGAKGGVFTATRGLTDAFGERCFNSALAESSIVGAAIGMAMRGLRPVPEIQFGDYIWTAMMQLRNELSTMRYRSNNTFSSPVVLRVPIGGYIHGALCHSQNIEAFFAHIPGLKIALPSTALDAYGLLKAAIRGDDPVLFLEHKGMYRQSYAASPLPEGDDWVLPFGKAKVRREGDDVTVLTWGALVQRSLQAADALSDQGISVEVVDLRTINPVDWELLEQSVRKTGKCLVAHEDTRVGGFGAEVASELGERCFSNLDASIRRYAAADTPIPFNWDLEEEILPQMAGLTKAIADLANW